MNLPAFMKKNLDIYLKNYLKQKASNCKLCNGTLIIEGDNDVKNCPDCIDKTVPHRTLIYANIGMDYLGIELNDIKQVFSQDCFEGITEIVGNIEDVIGKLNIFIHRNDDNHSYGTSTAGMLMIKELIRKGHECFVVSCSSLIDYFFGFGDKTPDIQKKEMMDFIQFVPILLINDLAHEFKKHDGKDFLYMTFINFLGKRKLNGKMTILSTEMTMGEFEGDYSGSIVSHIKQHYLPFNVKCHTGKKKHSAEAKFKNTFADKMPALMKYMKKEPIKHLPPPEQAPPVETAEDYTDDKKPSQKQFIGSTYRGEK